MTIFCCSKKLAFVLILAFNFLVSPNVAIAQQSTEPVKGTCDYYLYQDSIRECGKRGYLIKYGYKYCNFFIGSHFSKFSEEGQKWALEMGHCLQLNIHVLSDTISCKELKKLARKSHLPCLLESGYLDLAKKDQRVYKCLGARNPLNWPAGLYYMMKLRKAAKKRKASK